MISKELYEKVYKEELDCAGIEVMEIVAHENHTLICISYEAESYCSDSNENIYEVAYRCKEWAYSKGYSLISWINTRDSWFVDIRENGNMVVECKKETTEPEAIFKACQWILDNES